MSPVLQTVLLSWSQNAATEPQPALQYLPAERERKKTWSDSRVPNPHCILMLHKSVFRVENKVNSDQFVFSHITLDKRNGTAAGRNWWLNKLQQDVRKQQITIELLEKHLACCSFLKKSQFDRLFRAHILHHFLSVSNGYVRQLVVYKLQETVHYKKISIYCILLACRTMELRNS